MKATTSDQLIYVSDSSNIEARMLAWLAGHDVLVDAFRNKKDAYSLFASKLFGRPITKADVLERFIGKVCVLGLGYGMGWTKFMNTLAVGALGGPPVYFTEEEARNAVNLYRADNAPIVAYWGAADMAIGDMFLGNARQWGPLTVQKDCIVMPNGMALQYPGLRIEVLKEGQEIGPFGLGFEYWNGKFWKKLYGGLLVENITQAMSRIVLFTQMLNMNKRVFLPEGGRICLNVHDEAIGVGPSYGAIKLEDSTWVNAEKANALFDRMSAEMRTPLTWCPDLPLDSDGGFDFSYSK